MSLPALRSRASIEIGRQTDENAQQWIEEYRRFCEESLDRLDDYLKQLQTTEKKHDRKK
jgi:hypothetical protein